MITITDKDLEKAEEEIGLKALKIAYEASDGISDLIIQRLVYALARDYIICGARMMEEELQNKKDK